MSKQPRLESLDLSIRATLVLLKRPLWEVNFASGPHTPVKPEILKRSEKMYSVKMLGAWGIHTEKYPYVWGALAIHK